MVLEAIEALPLANTPEVFGLHSNAEIGYYTQAARDMWGHLLELQPQTGIVAGELISWLGARGGFSKNEEASEVPSSRQPVSKSLKMSSFQGSPAAVSAVMTTLARWPRTLRTRCLRFLTWTRFGSTWA